MPRLTSRTPLTLELAFFASSRLAQAVGVAIFVLGLLPVAAYWAVVGEGSSLPPLEAVRLLNEPGADALLVDVRPKADYDVGHLDGAVHWPFSEIQAVAAGRAGKRVPDALRGRTLLLICDSGIDSARAFQLLGKAVDARSVSGGMQEWIASVGAQAPAGKACRLRNAQGTVRALPYRGSPGIEQAAILSTFWLVKPFYMLLSLVLAWVLRRARAADLAALHFGLLFFFLGEAFCYANYFVFTDTSLLFEYLHSFGMVLSFAFAAYALLEGLDRRVIRYSDPGQQCAALPLCGACPKYTEARCGLKRLFLYLTPACAVLCFLPLTAEPYWVSYNSNILWVFYNYSHRIAYQLFEIRVCPLLALPLFLAALGILCLGRRDPVSRAKIVFCAGIGYLGFGLFRLFLFAPFRDHLVWFIYWEEMTELIYICGVGFTLFVFRHRLLAEARE